MNYTEKMRWIRDRKGQSRAAERICSEIICLDGVSAAHGGEYDREIERAADFIIGYITENGAVTNTAVAEAEAMLAPLAGAVKSYTALFVSHAHIDMNWMWGYNETAAITVDTFRTVLDMMAEYPDFTFAQSQASTYEIIEKFRPDMLDEIKARIKEGRWEVTAAEWVEPDKNMPDGESLTRQILQSRKYLSRLLDISPDSLCIDFVPDTFGHNANVPEILADAGVKYMYHCRGTDGPRLYRFVAPSGKSTFNYREFRWYNGEISTESFEIVPAFCSQEKVDTFLCVYGVGDHGGGPSRRDIERITEYSKWPLTPTIRFGTFREFFDRVSVQRDDFPEIKRELNCLFTGCYTTQSRIKAANRTAEARMNDCEALNAASSVLTGAANRQRELDAPWRNILFNHFHDIIPGSGTIETREYAMGRFQETMAAVTTSATRAMREIADSIDTSGIAFDPSPETVSEGGGVGYWQAQETGFRFPSAERGRGSVRVFHVFNPTGNDRDEYTEITVWDWHYDLSLAGITDGDGEPADFCVTESGQGYWGHSFTKLLVRAKVAAFGYSTLILRLRTPEGHLGIAPYDPPICDEAINDDPVVLENRYIRAVFDSKTARLVSLTDKESGEELISEPSCCFRYAEENPKYGMTSWRVGPLMKTVDINGANGARIYGARICPQFGQFSYEVKYGGSVIRASVMLKSGSRTLDYSVTVDWNEPAVHGERIPQLSFAVPVSYKTTGKSISDIPYGQIVRNAVSHDVPALSFIGICGESEKSVGIISDCKYGFRVNGNCGSVTVTRSAYDPDPYPERGIHSLRIGVTVCRPDEMKGEAEVFCRPMPFVSGKPGNGSLPLSGSVLSVNGNVRVSCLKNRENGEGVAVRLYDVTGVTQNVTLSFPKPVREAFYADPEENPVSAVPVVDGTAVVSVPGYSTVTVTVGF